MTTSKVFVREVKKRKTYGSSSIISRYCLVHSEPRLEAFFGKGKVYECKTIDHWTRLFEYSVTESVWISTRKEKTEELLQAAVVFLASSHGKKKPSLGSILMLQPPREESLPALHAIFRHVAGQVSSYKILPIEELAMVLLSPKEEAQDLFIGGSFDPTTATFTLTRGNFKEIIVPLSLFRPSRTATPDSTDFAVIDYGHAIRLGKYESATDAILYELDPEYRKRLKAKQQNEDKGFGPSLRRLRIQRRLTREDFPSITAKTIARIERGEVEKPHGRTLRILAETLGVKPDDIETF